MFQDALDSRLSFCLHLKPEGGHKLAAFGEVHSENLFFPGFWKVFENGSELLGGLLSKLGFPLEKGVFLLGRQLLPGFDVFGNPAPFFRRKF